MTIVIVPWVVPPRKMKHAVLYPVTFWTYRLLTSWFSISILVVGGTRCRRWGRNQRLVGEQSISSHVNILASTVALHAHVLSGYWAVLWKENYVVWIALELWLNACPWLAWNLITFKWAKGSHLLHNMTIVLVPMWSRMGLIDIWHMWIRVEKRPS